LDATTTEEASLEDLLDQTADDEERGSGSLIFASPHYPYFII
jgi:hypothetical protein